MIDVTRRDFVLPCRGSPLFDGRMRDASYDVTYGIKEASMEAAPLVIALGEQASQASPSVDAEGKPSVDAEGKKVEY